jgi:hypothetical protein
MVEIKSYYGGAVEHIKLGDHTKDIQAYLNYYNIVGDDDGGKMMTDAEFEQYKKKVAFARANHLYVYYVNKYGQECKAIGPSSMCFCTHRYRNHNFDNIKSKNVNCKNCKCKLFNYIPVHGSLIIKCGCKHSFEDHDPLKKNCLKCGCKKFTSNYTCDCGLPYDLHKTVIETRQERIKNGKNVDSGNNLAAGIGGLTSFSSMVGAEYNEHYKDLLEGNGYGAISEGNKKYLGDNKISGMAVGNTKSPLDLFNQPNKYGSEGMFGSDNNYNKFSYNSGKYNNKYKNYNVKYKK